MRFSFGASSWIVMPRGTTISPSGTGASAGVSCGATAGPRSSNVATTTLLAPGPLARATGTATAVEPTGTTTGTAADRRDRHRATAAGTATG